MNSTRLAIVLSHPTQYYSPWFQWMRAHNELCFRVFYLSDFGLRPAVDEKFGKTFAWDVDLTSGYDWEVVPNTADRPDTLRYDGLKNPTLPSRLKAWKPTAILLFGYNYHTHLRLIAWARLRRLPLIFRGDSHIIGRPRMSWMKRRALHFLYAQFSAVTYVGQANREYFLSCGVAEKKLFFAPHAVDSERFTSGDASARAEAKRLRQEFGCEERKVILFAGKLIPNKQPRELLQAFLEIADPQAILIFVGDGPEKTGLVAEARNHPQALGRIIFMPFANQSEMPARYALADLFVLPSRGNYETWGLAVNEAMHLGVPCLVSDHVGAQRDLVHDGKTGWVFRMDEVSSLRSKLREALSILADAGRAARIREQVLERISRYTYEQATIGLKAALDHAQR